MIQYNTPSKGILQQYDFSLNQSVFLAAGSFIIPVTDAVIMMLIYKIPNFNNTWNTNNPFIIFLTDALVFNKMDLTFSGGTAYGSPVFTKYPDFNLDATIANAPRISWSGNAALAADPNNPMLFSFFYVQRSF